MSRSPLISVILAVYNGGDFLKESIDSILIQSEKDFELIIIDDCSSDNSVDIVNSYDDSRIRLLKNSRNSGLTRSLNIGLREARGRYIARMDADDIAYKERFQKQVDFLQNNPRMVMCGTWAEIFGIYGNDKVFDYPSEPHFIKAEMVFLNPFVHSTIMFDKSRISEEIRYDEAYKTAQDYELWSRLSSKYSLGKVEEVLLKYRFHKTQITLDRKGEQADAADSVRVRELERIDIKVKKNELTLHRAISMEDYSYNFGFIESAGKWFEKLVKANQDKGYYDNEAFFRVNAYKWYRICSNATNNGFKVFLFYIRCCGFYRVEGFNKNFMLFLKSLIYWGAIKRSFLRNLKRKLFGGRGENNG